MKTFALTLVALVALVCASNCAWDAKPACGPGSDYGPCPVPIPGPAFDPDAPTAFSAKGPALDAGADAPAPKPDAARD